jgi:cytochrome bd-type quinol oxidase subunit 2
MEILWFGVLATLLVGYFALEGFDIGLGMLVPVLGRAEGPVPSQERRDRLVAAMAPFVLANEVWLVALVGVLFGAFPTLEGEVLSALYPLVVALLLSWILRDAGLWFRRRADGAAWRGFWDTVLGLGSLGLALTWGLALAAVARGFSAPLLDALGIASGVVVTLVFLVHGWTFAAWRLPGDPAVRGARRTGRGLLLSAGLAAAPAAAPIAMLAAAVLDHAAPAETLTVLTIIAGPLLPVLIGAQIWVWRTFSKVTVPSFF